MKKNNTQNVEMTYRSDIGMFCIDRPRNSCKYKTAFCKKHCYNEKLNKVFKFENKPSEQRFERQWQSITGSVVFKTLSTKRNFTDRIRLMSRGEALKNSSDYDRINDICSANQDKLVWLPTRAWIDTKNIPAIKKLIADNKNLRLLCSIDPSNTAKQVKTIIDNHLSSMFFGNDTISKFHGLNFTKCIKTWQHVNGACQTCNLCFGSNIIHVHLKKH